MGPVAEDALDEPAPVELMEEGADVFVRDNGRREQEQAAQEVGLYEQIGRLKMELEWLKKKAAPFT